MTRHSRPTRILILYCKFVIVSGQPLMLDTRTFCIASLSLSAVSHLYIISGKPLIIVSGKPLIIVSGKPLIIVSGKPLIILSGKPLIIVSDKPLITLKVFEIFSKFKPIFETRKLSKICFRILKTCFRISKTCFRISIFSRFENISKTFAGCWLEFLVTIIADIVIPLVVAQKAGAINSHPESRSHK